MERFLFSLDLVLTAVKFCPTCCDRLRPLFLHWPSELDVVRQQPDFCAHFHNNALYCLRDAKMLVLKCWFECHYSTVRRNSWDIKNKTLKLPQIKHQAGISQSLSHIHDWEVCLISNISLLSEVMNFLLSGWNNLLKILIVSIFWFCVF